MAMMVSGIEVKKFSVPVYSSQLVFRGGARDPISATWRKLNGMLDVLLYEARCLPPAIV